ncbi:MAG: hypothetical protein SVK08_01665 [Halobacteriota archaeon]|nr:hypothetical protein [Halobacteriota archaeon]
MDEKISGSSELVAKFATMIEHGNAYRMGRDCYMIQFVDNEWQLLKMTPAGHVYKTDMQVSTLLYHLSRAEKS